MMRRTAGASLVAIAMAIAPGAPSAATTWLRLDTPSFVVIGDAGEKRLQAVATDLERFREVLSRVLREGATSSAVPTVVVAFARDRGLEPFAPVYAGKSVKVDGLMLAGADINYIALSAEGGSKDRLQTVLHEYAHALIANNSPGLPLWLNEGLAELYSTITLGDGGRAAVLGRVKAPYLQLLNEKLLFPFEELIKVDHTSSLYNERERSSVFYAQSWALVHMLMMGNADRGSMLTGFVRAVSSGVTPQDAWRQVSGQNSIEKALREYVSREGFNTFHFRFDKAISATRTPATPLGESEVAAFLGDFLVQQRQFKDAEPYLERAVVPPAGRLATAMSARARAAQSPSTSLGTGTRAVSDSSAAPSKDWLTEYYVAAAALSALREDSDSDASELTATRTALEQVLRERPTLAHAWKMQAVQLLIDGKNADEARRAIKRARALAPGRDDYALVHAEALARLGEFDLARSVLGPLLANASQPALREVARNQMRRILMMAALPPGTARDRAGRSTKIPIVRNLETGERREEGLFERLECDGNGLLAHVRFGDRVARFRARGFDVVRFITYRTDLTGQVPCGARTPADLVLVTWMVDASLGTGADGILVALEFLPPGDVDLAAVRSAACQLLVLVVVLAPVAYAARGSLRFQPPPDWVWGNTEQTRDHLLLEFVKKGERIDGWTELLTLQQFRTTRRFSSPREFYDLAREAGEERCPGLTDWRILANDNGIFLYERKSPGMGEGQPAQSELGRLIVGRKTGYRVAFTTREPLTAEIRARWITWLLNLSLPS